MYNEKRMPQNNYFLQYRYHDAEQTFLDWWALRKATKLSKTVCIDLQHSWRVRHVVSQSQLPYFSQ
jgi:hypothetical protein